MLSETIVTALLEASITGAGLVLAVYALITPISDKIFKERTKKLESLITNFEKEKEKITIDASNKDFKHLRELKDSINEIRIFPRYLGFGIFITFAVFMTSALADIGWLANASSQNGINDPVLIAFFMTAVFLFTIVGVLTIFEIYDTMRREFEDIKKKQKEIKETSNEDLEKPKKDI
jgi:hypothetical protein